jgi:Myb-like DNA-binding domain
VTIQHTRPFDRVKAPHLNGVVEREPTLKTAKVIVPTSSNTTPSNTVLPVPPVHPSPSVDQQNAILPATDRQKSALSSKTKVSPFMSPSTFSTVKLSAPQPKVVPSKRQEITPPKPEDIPKLSEAKSTSGALRTVVMTRLLHDRQTREERVNPVLRSNLQLAALSRDPRPSISAGSVIEEVAEERRKEERIERFSSLRGLLLENFQHRQTSTTEKAHRLQKEYGSLQEHWVNHCAALNEQARPAVSAESETVQPMTRATRRSTTMSDAVRSDLEMEQIIASLGYDEATDPNQLSLRNLATVPDMISVTNGKVDYVFDDTNHLVDNPSEYYGPTTGIHDWTEKEKAIFLDKFAAFPKQFGVIAEHIPNKTATQCVDYYYLHKKRVIDFRKVISQYAPGKRRRRGTGRKKGNGLLADIRQHDAEVHGESEPPPPPPPPGRGRRRMARPPPKEPKEPKKPTVSRRTTILQVEESSTATPTPEPETRPRRRRATGVASAASTTNATPATTPAPAATPALSTNASLTPPTLAASLSRTISITIDDAEEESLVSIAFRSLHFELNSNVG